jgi:hypothetical protein
MFYYISANNLMGISHIKTVKRYFKSVPAPPVSAGQQKNNRGAAAVKMTIAAPLRVVKP